jgi:hypothetical protein
LRLTPPRSADLAHRRSVPAASLEARAQSGQSVRASRRLPGGQERIDRPFAASASFRIRSARGPKPWRRSSSDSLRFATSASRVTPIEASARVAGAPILGRSSSGMCSCSRVGQRWGVRIRGTGVWGHRHGRPATLRRSGTQDRAIAADRRGSPRRPYLVRRGLRLSHLTTTKARPDA